MSAETEGGRTMGEQLIAGMNVERRGKGPTPLVLLHGFGGRWQVWTPLLDDLGQDFDIAAVDLAGFGRSAPVDLDIERPIEHAVRLGVRLLDDLGWDRPHIAGNSLGGWLAYELAKVGRAASATGLAPAGCWPLGREPRQLRPFFRMVNTLSQRRGVQRLMASPVARTAMMYGVAGKPWKIPADIAVADAQAFSTPTLEMIVAGAGRQAFVGGRDIDVPVTAAFFSRDPLIRRRQSTLAELPPHTVQVYKRGIGHVPTWDDPAWCAGTIRATVARAPAPSAHHQATM